MEIRDVNKYKSQFPVMFWNVVEIPKEKEKKNK